MDEENKVNFESVENEAKSSPTFTPHSAKSSEREETNVLHPDNPLLEKFQKALKEHLLRQINHLKNDIFEYDCGTKKNNARREELGIMVYEQQQILEKQQKTLDLYISKVQTATAACEEMQNLVKEKKELFKKQRDKVYEAEAKELELRNEIEATNLLVHQISEWEENLESDLTVKKRVFEKSRKEKLKLLEDKRTQDVLIYKLMTRIWFLERELDRMDVQMKVKEAEREDLAQTVALGNTNIEAMEAEYRCLMHSWNSVVIAIGNRDKVLSCLNKELSKSEEHFKSVVSEIEQVKKLSQKEMRRNEEFTMLKNRFLADVQVCKAALDVEIEKKTTLEQRMFEMQRIIEQTEADIQRITDEAHETHTILSGLTREHEQLDTQKGELEEQIMRALEEQVTNNKMLMTLQRALTQFKIKNREIEIQVATIENKIASVMSEMEAQKFANFEGQRYLKELEEQLKELGMEADRYQDEMKHIELKIAKKQREVDLLNNKYLKMVDKSGGTFVSPLEMKITTLEKNIEEIQEYNKKLQLYWLREQSNLIKISEERQEQIHNNNLMCKQILILEQKNLRVSDELEACRKLQDKVVRSINNLHSQLTVMGDNFVKTKGLKINMDKDNEVLRQDYIYKLKDAELECLKLEDEITQIEEDKVNLSNELIAMNRETLEWEKKFLGAKETKNTMIEERGQEGEVGTMKAEIHRMNVRYSQLKKVQDVLVQDLEHCVSRRDAMMTAAEAREKRVKGGMEKTRINFNRKMDDMRNKSKQMENQIAEMAKKTEHMAKEIEQIRAEIAEMSREIETTNEHCVEIRENVEEALTKRQMNFELLLQVQKKLNTYNDLAKGRKPHLVHRSESALSSAYSREISTNSKLCKIVENLQSDFPNHGHELVRICNTLKLPVYVYFQ
ncbi:coiled-coil domain-containing protein 40 [Tribolium castaneum]|uniref:coiled-coil domain-containing protein 40 n=1 Tax=Tribolium castaneum TaxID=7070 RepID=UPI00017586C3|nr:PREDICTED: coiled-coil domain-containing protein 40 [Tribolium castaneum]|eukprot:XP_971171.2 PREDICTED: coiled-coil domain-containing protein 40 [Tribolium castaneum]